MVNPHEIDGFSPKEDKKSKKCAPSTPKIESTPPQIKTVTGMSPEILIYFTNTKYHKIEIYIEILSQYLSTWFSGNSIDVLCVPVNRRSVIKHMIEKSINK